MKKVEKNTDKKAKEIQIHGKSETFKKTTLDQVWGDTGVWKYKTLNVDNYRAQLGEMNMSDLYRHATELGIFPTPERERLIKKLMSTFQEHTLNYQAPDNNARPIKISKAAEKILAEGR